LRADSREQFCSDKDKAANDDQSFAAFMSNKLLITVKENEQKMNSGFPARFLSIDKLVEIIHININIYT